jgi:hypothetical protein
VNFFGLWFILLWVTFFSVDAVGEQLVGPPEAYGDEGESEKGSSTLTPGHTTVWLERSTSLSTKTPLLLARATDGTKVLLSPAMLDDFTSMIRAGLEDNGFAVLDSAQTSASSAAVRIEPIIIRYDPGSAGARWLSPGLGATICIIRATLSDPITNDVVGEILSWRNIASGGLFSIGAHKYVPRHTSEDIGKALREALEERQ